MNFTAIQDCSFHFAALSGHASVCDVRIPPCKWYQTDKTSDLRMHFILIFQKSVITVKHQIICPK